MSKIPPKFEPFLAGKPEDYPRELRELLTSKPPEFWGEELLNKMGHVKRPILKVIRAKCLDCNSFSPKEVRLCQSFNCDLWPYRMGTDPFRKGREAEDA